jgi:hypothetical protein
MPRPAGDSAPSLLEQVRGLIERTYDHQTGLGPLAPFIIGDQGYRRVCAARNIVRRVESAAGAAEGGGAQLLLSREADGTWRAAVYFPDELIAELEAHPPTRRIDTLNVAAFAAFIEEIDHLLLVAARIRGGPDLSLLELELHANVTKELVVRHFLDRSPAAAGRDRLPVAWVRHHLFLKPSFLRSGPGYPQSLPRRGSAGAALPRPAVPAPPAREGDRPPALLATEPPREDPPAHPRGLTATPVTSAAGSMAAGGRDPTGASVSILGLDSGRGQRRWMIGSRKVRRSRRRFAVRFGTRAPERLGYTQNISESGLYIETNFIIDPGTDLQLEIDTPAKMFEMWATVVWARRYPMNLQKLMRGGLGCRFAFPSQEWIDFYERWRAEIASG